MDDKPLTRAEADVIARSLIEAATAHGARTVMVLVASQDGISSGTTVAPKQLIDFLSNLPRTVLEVIAEVIDQVVERRIAAIPDPAGPPREPQ